MLLSSMASTSENDALAMGLASRMKFPTTIPQLSKPKSSYKKHSIAHSIYYYMQSRKENGEEL